MMPSITFITRTMIMMTIIDISLTMKMTLKNDDQVDFDSNINCGNHSDVGSDMIFTVTVALTTTLPLIMTMTIALTLTAIVFL